MTVGKLVGLRITGYFVGNEMGLFVFREADLEVASETSDRTRNSIKVKNCMMLILWMLFVYRLFLVRFKS